MPFQSPELNEKLKAARIKFSGRFYGRRKSKEGKALKRMHIKSFYLKKEYDQYLDLPNT